MLNERRTLNPGKIGHAACARCRRVFSIDLPPEIRRYPIVVRVKCPTCGDEIDTKPQWRNRLPHEQGQQALVRLPAPKPKAAPKPRRARTPAASSAAEVAGSWDSERPGDRTCTKCGQAKSRGEFGRRTDRPAGLRTECRACAAAYARAHYRKRGRS